MCNAAEPFFLKMLKIFKINAYGWEIISNGNKFTDNIGFIA